MPCIGRRASTQTVEQRIDQVAEAMRRLKRYLATGAVRVVVGPAGGVAFAGWRDRDDVSDVCAYRSLAAEGSWELRQAVARAEAQSGRKVDARAVAAGLHSHDGGRSWGRD